MRHKQGDGVHRELSEYGLYLVTDLKALGNWLSENYNGKLYYDRFRGVFGASSSFAAISEVFWERIAPKLLILLLFR